MNAACETTPPSPKKRNASIAGFPNGVRPVKRRAAKACQTCRSRKVRCDVVESGPPCNNCRLDQIQCIVSDSRRKRRPRRSIGEDAGTEAGECKSISTCPGEVVNVSSSSDSSGSPACVDGPVDSSGGSPFELELDHHVPHMLCQYRPIVLSFLMLIKTKIGHKAIG